MDQIKSSSKMFLFANESSYLYKINQWICFDEYSIKKHKQNKSSHLYKIDKNEYKKSRKENSLKL